MKYKGFNCVPKTDKELADYLGMNRYAAKQIGLNIVPKEKDIWYDAKLENNHNEKLKLIHHEIYEWSLMKYQDFDYWDAHIEATKFEGLSWSELNKMLNKIKK